MLEPLPERCRESELYKNKIEFMEAQREYNEHFVQQDGMCAGCGKPHYKHRKKSVLRPDRDPETGKIRRLLCSDCLEAN